MTNCGKNNCDKRNFYCLVKRRRVKRGCDCCEGSTPKYLCSTKVKTKYISYGPNKRVSGRTIRVPTAITVNYGVERNVSCGTSYRPCDYRNSPCCSCKSLNDTCCRTVNKNPNSATFCACDYNA